MSKFKCLIIEDEENSKILLTATIEEFCPQLEIVGYADSVQLGIDQITQYKPDIMFLDIELEDGNAFDILEQLDTRDQAIIFTTAYDDFALSAFKYEAVDYLLKPYSPSDIVSAVEKVKRRTYSNELIKRLISDSSVASKKKRIAVSSSGGLVMIDVDNIMRIEADRSYCNLFESDGSHLMVSRPMKDVERLFNSTQFFRVHDGHIINVDYLKKFSYEDGGIAILNDGTQVPVSRRRKQEFINFIKQ